jgi:hypothetical protein
MERSAGGMTLLYFAGEDRNFTKQSKEKNELFFKKGEL